MSYEIKLKGRRDSLHVESNQSVELVKEAWVNYQMGRQDDSIAELGSWTGPISSINDFIKIEPLRSESQQVDYDGKFLSERLIIINEPPSVRARRMGFFRLLYWTFTNKRSELVTSLVQFEGHEYTIEQVAEILQERFFTDHPTRMYPDPKIFRGILIPNIASGNAIGLQFIERQLISDLRLENKTV